MFSRGNERKDKRNKRLDDNKGSQRAEMSGQGGGNADEISREELFAQNEDARKMFEELRSLRDSVERLKENAADDGAGASENTTDAAGAAGAERAAGAASEDAGGSESDLFMEDSEEILAARRAIIEQARKDTEAEKFSREEAVRKELEAMRAQREAQGARERVAQKAQEAEKKRQEAADAEKRLKEIKVQQDHKVMGEEFHAGEQAYAVKRADTPEADTAVLEQPSDARPDPDEQIKALDEAKKEMISAQEKQNAELEAVSETLSQKTERIAAAQQSKLSEKQELIRQEKERIEAIVQAYTDESFTREQRIRREIELREERAKLERLIKEEKAEAARQEKAVRIQRRREEKQRRAEEKVRAKKAKKAAIARVKRERKRLEQKSIADAELGGGIVNVNGVTVNTEIKDTVHVSWKDFFGIASKEERTAATEEEKQQLREEREKRTEAAREIVELSAKHRNAEYERSKAGKTARRFKNFCEIHKASLLTSFSILILAAMCVAGVFNYCTAYEYSYNGKTLGLVKEKDEVLRITDLVQSALTEEKNIDVVIDAKKDISFNRVFALGDVKTDSSEEVLKRLTYMGDLNVKAYGIYVNGKKAGSVESKEAAAQVLQDIKDRYTGDWKDPEIEEAVIIEKVDIREGNTDLQNVFSEEDMVERLCTSGKKETVHPVVVGETFADIAKLYSISEKDLLKDNPDVDPKKLEVGSNIVIRQNAPILTVRITEKVTYDKVIKHEVQKKDDPDLYEGYTETTQKGEDGSSTITSRVTMVNGEQIEEKPLETKVNKKAVPEIIMIGTKERPPSVGSGKYIWPLSGGYTVTSNFGSRWGRMHEGLDLGCPVGSDVMAADGGVVVSAGYSGGYGYMIEVDHQNGMSTRYAHNSQLLVSVGDKVFQGQHIAESGNTGRSTGPHLHFEIRVHGAAQNPYNYLP